MKLENSPGARLWGDKNKKFIKGTQTLEDYLGQATFKRPQVLEAWQISKKKQCNRWQISTTLQGTPLRFVRLKVV